MSESNTLLPGQHWQCVILLSNSPFRQDWFSVLRLESLPHWLIMQCPACVRTGCMHQEVVTTWYSYSFSDTTVILCPQQAHKKKTLKLLKHMVFSENRVPQNPVILSESSLDVSEPFFDRQTQRPFGDPNGRPNVTIALENGLDTHGDLEKMWHVWWGNLG